MNLYKTHFSPQHWVGNNRNFPVSMIPSGSSSVWMKVTNRTSSAWFQLTEQKKPQTTLQLPLFFCSNNTQTNSFPCLYLVNWSLSVPVHSWRSSFWGWGRFLGWSIDVISDRLVVPEAWSLTVKDSHMRAVMLTHSWGRPHTHTHVQ